MKTSVLASASLLHAGLPPAIRNPGISFVEILCCDWFWDHGVPLVATRVVVADVVVVVVLVVFGVVVVVMLVVFGVVVVVAVVVLETSVVDTVDLLVGLLVVVGHFLVAKSEV